MKKIKHILIIDDEPDIIQVIDDQLRSFLPSPLNIVSAPDGVLGLQKARNQKFDLIITDLKMPKLDGATLVKQLKTLNRMNQPERVLILSGLIENDKSSEKVGAISFMPKPCTHQKLKDYIEEAFADTPAAKLSELEGSVAIEKAMTYGAVNYFQKELEIELKLKAGELDTPFTEQVCLLSTLFYKKASSNIVISCSSQTLQSIVKQFLFNEEESSDIYQESFRNIGNKIFSLANRELDKGQFQSSPVFVAQGENLRFFHDDKEIYKQLCFETEFGVLTLEFSSSPKK